MNFSLFDLSAFQDCPTKKLITAGRGRMISLTELGPFAWTQIIEKRQPACNEFSPDGLALNR